MNTQDLNKRLLVVDDEENMRHMLTVLMGRSGYQVESAADGAEALEKVENKRYDVVLCDLKMPRLDGIGFLTSAKSYLTQSIVIVMSAYGTIEVAVEAMKLGAYDYISKPFKTDEILMVLKKGEEHLGLKAENLRLKQRIQSIEKETGLGSMIGSSPRMQDVFRLANRVAAFDTTVLITGESGTGKELVARGVHAAGPRSTMAFVAVNCGGIPETLLESELFGYRKGAFTGADRDKPGLFQEADQGTLFLDEIGELPLALQVKLLRVLQEGDIRPVGGTGTQRVDVRIIAATARDLNLEVAAGRFREDLFYRLNVLPMHLPPLRERIDDIPLLAAHFLSRMGKRLGKVVDSIDPEAMKHLMAHPWPGNVRELENIIERAVVMADGMILLPAYLPEQMIGAASTPDAGFPQLGLSLKVARRAVEKELIARALEKTGGNRTHAARLLEISHPSLLAKIKAYGISR
jgi:two-component system response regulator AtoC